MPPQQAPRHLRAWWNASDHPFGVLLVLDTPGPGTAALGTIEFGTMVMATLTFYMYGDQAAAHVAHETPRWQDVDADMLPDAHTA